MRDSECPAVHAVVGAGAAGTLTAIHLVRYDPNCRVVLIDPAERPGPGLAYGTSDPGHLLNVRAGRMSALVDEPDHFLGWAEGNGHRVAPDAFPSRAVYGEYLVDLLAAAVGTGRVEVRRERALDLETSGRLTRLHTTSGTVVADSVVLATGNAAPPALPWELDHRGQAWCLADPWRSDDLVPPRGDGPVVLVGTGLTAVDVALTLGRDPHRRMVAVSRHGLLPTSHAAGPESVWPTTVPAGGGALTVSRLLALLRVELAAATAAGVDWRAVVDGLRPAVSGLWARLPEGERRAFLRHAARYWEVHRHRMAPEVARRVGELRAGGRLDVRRARPVDAVPDEDGCRVRLVEPGGRAYWLRAAAVVNCTGPRADPTRPPTPLVDALLARGLVRADPLRLGLDVSTDGGLIDGAGRVDPRMLAVGSLRRGRLWESTAVPEIRRQAADAAAVLTRRRADRSR